MEVLCSRGEIRHGSSDHFTVPKPPTHCTGSTLSALTRERVDGVKFEADAILRQLEGADAHLGKQVVQVLCDLQRKTDSDSSSISRLLFYSIQWR